MTITNIPGIKEISGANKAYYRYSNYNGTITSWEILSQGREIDKEYVKTISQNEQFKKMHPDTKDTTIYRLFEINPFHFWRWGEYIFNWRYRLPYKNWKEIKKRRGYGELKYANSFQEF